MIVTDRPLVTDCNRLQPLSYTRAHTHERYAVLPVTIGYIAQSVTRRGSDND